MESVMRMDIIILVPGYLAKARGGKFYESDIYNDERNRETVKEFDKNFVTGDEPETN